MIPLGSLKALSDLPLQRMSPEKIVKMQYLI